MVLPVLLSRAGRRLESRIMFSMGQAFNDRRQRGNPALVMSFRIEFTDVRTFQGYA